MRDFSIFDNLFRPIPAYALQAFIKLKQDAVHVLHVSEVFLCIRDV